MSNVNVICPEKHIDPNVPEFSSTPLCDWFGECPSRLLDAANLQTLPRILAPNVNFLALGFWT